MSSFLSKPSFLADTEALPPVAPRMSGTNLLKCELPPNLFRMKQVPPSRSPIDVIKDSPDTESHLAGKEAQRLRKRPVP